MNLETKMQRAFDKVWKWYVIEQNRPSFEPKLGRSVYLGPKGSKCSAGLLVPSRYIDDESNLWSFETLVAREPRLLKTFEGMVEFVSELQGCHDWACEWNEARDNVDVDLFRVLIKRNLLILVDAYELTIPTT